jgi:hypothetical protein
MGQTLSRKQIEELYLPPADDFVTVDVPRMNFMMVDGEGGPNHESHAQAIQWLFSTAYPLRRVGRERMGRDFVEPPLEGLWWADDVADFVAGKLEKLKWRMMIPAAAEWLTEDLFNQAVAGAAVKLGEAPRSLRLDSYHEGLSVQIMHVGPPAEQRDTMARLHGEYLPVHNLAPSGPHHEIYLNDPRRVAPAKLKTVLRQPVRRVDCGAQNK